MNSDPLDTLVHDMLLERTQDLDGPRLAAFIDGWGSVLRLLEHREKLLPNAPEAVHEAIETMLRRIRAAQDRVLDDDDL